MGSERRFFGRDDGVSLEVIAGFREEVLRLRPGRSPRPGWGAEEYDAAATNLLCRAELRLEHFRRYGSEVSGARVLEVGCGSGLHSLALATQPFDLVVGIDLHLPLFEEGAAAARLRRLAQTVLKKLGLAEDIESALRKLPIQLRAMDVRRLRFSPDDFDIIWSVACLEHVAPIEPALAEMARVLKPGGLMYHRIDPFYWVRGCHRPGLVDIPWAHARMSLNEYERFVRETEGRSRAARRSGYLRQLNRFTPTRWREIVESGPIEVEAWEETRPEWVIELLQRDPEIERTAVGVSHADLTCSLVAATLRSNHS